MPRPALSPLHAVPLRALSPRLALPAARQREGAFYASERVETAIAETAFYRLLFHLEAPAARLPARPTEHTAFRVPAATDRLIDLTAPPLVRDAALWRDPVRYGPCQTSRMPPAAPGCMRSATPRCATPAPGERRAARPGGFRDARPQVTQTWRVFPRPDAVKAWRDFPDPLRLEFARADFADDPRISA